MDSLPKPAIWGSALLRVLREGRAVSAAGSLQEILTITGACSGTIKRDLADLVVNGALLREGERRHARYPLCSPLRPAQHVTSNDGGAMAEEQQCGLIRRRVGVECTPLGSSSRPSNLIASTD